jgi:hypothetical protein
MAFEDDLGWEYFENDPEHSPRMKEHMDWHMAQENVNRTGNYGERFILFHRQYIAKFDQFRQTKSLLPVSPWDPATVIPPALAHVKPLTGLRDTDNPAAVNPLCITPTWATVAGGTTPAPGYGYMNLLQFQSLDELGRAIDSGWHGTVHNTIGGDMAQFHSPIDPVFWRWHKWVDQVAVNWQAARISVHIPKNIAAIVRILFGVVDDAPGIVIGPDGRPHRVPGGPGPDPGPLMVTGAVRNVLMGQLVHELGALVPHSDAQKTLQEIGAKLIMSA